MAFASDRPLRAASVLIVASVVMSSCTYGQILSGLTFGRSELRNLRVPVGNNPANPVLMLTCESVRVKPREVGIFRLGFAAQTVLQGLKLQILSAGCEGIWASEMGLLLSQDNFLRSSQVSNLCLLDPSGRELLSARLGKVVSAGKALLLEKVSLRNREGRNQEYPNAMLILGGEKAGCLTLPDTPDRFIAVEDVNSLD